MSIAIAIVATVLLFEAILTAPGLLLGYRGKALLGTLLQMHMVMVVGAVGIATLGLPLLGIAAVWGWAL
jgi:hypothetical protein